MHPPSDAPRAGWVARAIAVSATNPWLTVLFVAALAVWGWYALARSPLDAIPDLSDAQVIVFTEWPGQSPDMVEDQVTYPIASALLAAPRVAYVRGYSMFGMSFLYVIFEDGTDLYWARCRVLEYLDEARARLPEGVTPTLGPDATGIGWVFQYALVDKSGRHDLDELRTLQDLTSATPSRASPASPRSPRSAATTRSTRSSSTRLKLARVRRPDPGGGARGPRARTGGRRPGARAGRARESSSAAAATSSDRRDLEQVRAARRPGRRPGARRATWARCASGRTSAAGSASWNGEGEAVGGIVVMRYGENALDGHRRASRRGSTSCARASPRASSWSSPTTARR